MIAAGQVYQDGTLQVRVTKVDEGRVYYQELWPDGPLSRWASTIAWEESIERGALVLAEDADTPPPAHPGQMTLF